MPSLSHHTDRLESLLAALATTTASERPGPWPRRRTCRSPVRSTLLDRLQLGHLGGKLVDGWPRRGESCRRRFAVIGRNASGRSRWRQPAKVWGPASDRLSGRAAVGLPSQSGSDANKKRDQVADKGEPEELVEPR